MRDAHRLKMSVLLLAVNGVGCTAPLRPTPGPEPRAGELAGPFRAAPSHTLAPLPTDTRRGGRLSEMAALPPPPAPGERFVLDELADAVVDAELDPSGGERLAELLDEARDEGRPVDEYGTGALSVTELLGDDVHTGACEIPKVVEHVEFAGEEWELTLGLAEIENVIGDFTPALGGLSDVCIADLLQVAGEIEASEYCSSASVEAFFPEGSDCRACIEESAGDVVACQDQGRCAVEAPVLEESGGKLWSRMEATLLACAPDWTVPAYVLVELDDEGGLPDPFDFDRWGYICAPFWDGSAVSDLCAGGADTMRLGVSGLVEGMRAGDDDTPWYRHRLFYTPEIQLSNGTSIRWGWESSVGFAYVSQAMNTPDDNGDGVIDAGDQYFGFGYATWGLNPLELRPDGTDPEELDDTFARDWFGAIQMKSATTRDGVSIEFSNHSRCAADAWDDLDGDGVFRCTRSAAPEGGWLNDLPHFSWDPRDGITYPMATVTLASTGLPDPEIPGGIVPWIAGSSTLADPDWEDCTWSHSFEPDRGPIHDVPVEYDGASSLSGDTWRFGGHPEIDIRIILETNYPRHYCPDGDAP